MSRRLKGQSKAVRGAAFAKMKKKGMLLRARRMVNKAGFKTTKVDETPNYYRFRQVPPTKFKKGSFRTIDIGRKGYIKAVIAKPKSKKTTRIQSVIVVKKDLEK